MGHILCIRGFFYLEHWPPSFRPPSISLPGGWEHCSLSSQPRSYMCWLCNTVDRVSSLSLGVHIPTVTVSDNVVMRETCGIHPCRACRTVTGSWEALHRSQSWYFMIIIKVHGLWGPPYLSQLSFASWLRHLLAVESWASYLCFLFCRMCVIITKLIYRLL